MAVSSQQLPFLTCLPKVKIGVRLFTDVNWFGLRTKPCSRLQLPLWKPMTDRLSVMDRCMRVFDSRPLAPMIRNIAENPCHRAWRLALQARVVRHHSHFPHHSQHAQQSSKAYGLRAKKKTIKKTQIMLHSCRIPVPSWALSFHLTCAAFILTMSVFMTRPRQEATGLLEPGILTFRSLLRRCHLRTISLP